jgi:uncharacterized surface protein with fasciclin (FAS1) repeats
MVAAVLLLAVAPVAAAGHNSIVDIAVADGRFTTLVAAVQATGLTDALDGGDWTVFAPTDDAFAKLGLDGGNVAAAFSKEDLTDILLYHALEGSVKSDIAKTLVGDIVMANGKRAGLKVYEGSLYVNDDAQVIIPDIMAANGVIHVVDTVILGPWPRTEEAAAAAPAMPTADASIVDIAVADGRFDTLVAAVSSVGLVDALSSGPTPDGEWTVFAPIDDAFAKLGLHPHNVAGAFTEAELTDVLLYHVIEGGVTSEVAKTLVGDVTMANGKLAGLKVFDGSLYVNDDSKVVIENIVASNGVIHVVDAVILPPWPRE